MDIIIAGIREACRLIFTLDAEVFEVVLLSLRVSFVSLFVAAIVAIPLGIWIARHVFRGKHFLMRIIYTLMGLPPVLCGLFVYVMLMRRGPLGFLQLNYTVTAMMIAQILLIIPIILGLTINAAREKEKRLSSLAKTLGAGPWQTTWLFFFELRYGLLTAVITGFSRAISEVGAVMIVGGNIDGKTRVMTTYISQLKGMGNFERAMAVGIILLLISFTVNTVLYQFQKEKVIDILIEIKNLKKSYGSQCVLDIEALELPSHAVTAVVGPNGAGKSTLLNILADLLPKDSGEVLYDKSPVVPEKEMTLVFQQPYLIDTTVKKNIAWPLKLRKAAQEDIEAVIERLSGELNLSQLLSKRAGVLSLGEMQKVALARALSFSPKFLFLDEPCASLDPHTTQEIEKLLLKIKEEKQTTILFVTHNLAQAKRIADHVVLLHQGKVVECGEAESFFTAPVHPLTRKFMEGELLL